LKGQISDIELRRLQRLARLVKVGLNKVAYDPRISRTYSRLPSSFVFPHGRRQGRPSF
jgi:hypothetical protein